MGGRRPGENQPTPGFKFVSMAFNPLRRIYILLHSLPVVYLNPRLVASRLAAACNDIGTLKCAKMRKGFMYVWV